MPSIDFRRHSAQSPGTWLARALLIGALAGCRAGDDPDGAPVPAGGPVDSTISAVPGAEGRDRPSDTDLDEDRWTTGPVTATREASGVVTVAGIRVARHESFDRFVITLEGRDLPTHRVGFVEEPPAYCGSGEPVALRGETVLTVGLEPAQAHDDDGNVTVQPRDTVVNLPAILEIRIICDFEGQVQWALGVARSSAYRILELTDPLRIAVDIQH